VGQKVPEYIRLKAEGASTDALALILADNPLPFITGTLCDHVCQEACCRNDYEGSVEIRAVKLACARAASIPAQAAPHNASFKGKVAVIGAGPAGLACAHHLALAGVRVTVFDEAAEPGGVPANVIPRFRIPRADIAADVDRIASLGAKFRFGLRLDSLESLKAEGFTSFFVCVGAPLPRELPITGDAVPVVDALSFLEAASRLIDGAAGGDAAWPYGKPKSIVVAGGGNTAMDAARVALRLPGVEEVRISYRRSREDMPADEEELANALEEGAKLMDLSLPERAFDGPDGPRLSLRVMTRGERDASGRSSPKPTDETLSFDCDLLVAAVGEGPDAALLAAMGMDCGPSGMPAFDPATQATSRPGIYVGGDAARGPASIISAEADGRRAAYAILRAAGIEPPLSSYVPSKPDADRLAARGEFAESVSPASPAFASREAERCLRCDSACLRCVEVCPNRANFALPLTTVGLGELRQPIQILHIDALCNECGNCGVFCPYEGRPYREKPTLFKGRAAMEASHNVGFFFGKESTLTMRVDPDSSIVETSEGEWSRENWGGPLAALARAVFREHRYLIGGER
jgi:putative selenate reductase